MSILDFPRLHFQGLARIHAPTGYKNGLVDMGSNTVYMNGLPYKENHSASEYHEFLYNKGPKFNEYGKLDENGPFSQAMGWNFGGNGHFSIDAKIISTQREFGKVDLDDPVIGRSVDFWGHYNEYVKTTVNRARIFECDPASNWTNTIMLGQLAFGRLGDSNQVPYMVTAPIEGYQLARWQDFNYIRDLPLHILNDEFGKAAVYQFAISKDTEDFLWNDEVNISPTVSMLKSAMQREDVLGLVVQFSISNMSAPVQPDAPSFWELHGTIGLWCQDELKTYPHGRLLTSKALSREQVSYCVAEVPSLVASGATRRGAGGSMGNLTLQLNPQGISLNMITAVPCVGREPNAKAGFHEIFSKLDLGDLELCTVNSHRLIGKIPSEAYNKEAHQLTSGLIDIPFYDDWEDLRKDIENQGLCIIGSVDNERTVLVQEKEINLQVDDACLFIEFPNSSKGEDNAVELEVRSFVRGRPQSVQSIYVNQFYNPRAFPQLRYQFEQDSQNKAQIFHFPRSCKIQIVGLKPGKQDEKGEFSSSCEISTNQQGRGWFTLRGAKPGTTKVLISSSFNEIPCDRNHPDEAEIAYDNHNKLGFWNGSGFLAVRVMGDDWHLDEILQEDVDFNLIYEHILAFYEASFSFMKTEVFSLADKCKVATYARLMWQMSDPKNKTKTYYMPPTRDMSEAQSKLLLKFLQNQQQIGYIPTSVQLQPQQSEYKIQTKEELITALKQAAELEVAVMLQYIYAGYSVPNYVTGEEYVRRGLWTQEQLYLACGDRKEVDNYGMRGVLMEIAREEMIHFLLVNNILMAIGEPFYPAVPDFQQLNAKFPIDINFALEPLNALSLQYFIRLEMPDFLNEPIPTSGQLHTYGSLSELYGQIRNGLQNIPDLFAVSKESVGGEHRLFMRENLNKAHPDYQMQVYDLKSALFAVDVIVEHGEGSETESETFARSHYQKFRNLADSLSQEQINQSKKGDKRTWNPSYPSLRNPSLNYQDCNNNVVTVPHTRTVMEIFNESYFLMMQLMVQHFGSNPQGSLRRSKLMNASIDVMTGMMRPLGELLMTLPSGKRGKTAGPSFDIPTPEYIPNQEIAYQTISSQFQILAKRSHRCEVIPEAVSEMFDFYGNFFEELRKSEK
ncbi:ferritin-like domain-containing protein [Rivularia sp. UHCC 0363]|uniref:ferritin-like domain-containing protein n=1 Tax=Rivularia sp. UHCC 0363 TaxID=3110244 RepID=UPI002B208073|nr:ferritin-like domain-containing protein [Rivularia sp. UHCC 0363]MEA5595631.1 ferritin-like domain-containing protein [Rivularia sp. UHCC 0363]